MTIGLREGLMVLIVLVAVYILFVLLRMFHLRKPVVFASAVTKEEEPGAGKVPPNEPPSLPDGVAESASLPDWEKVPVALADDVLRSGLEQELAQLRDEVDAMRGELAALRNDMQKELAHLRASQSVSPIYGDAMQMAVSGYDPAAIAERCGIARAEADLVVALAKSQER